MYYGWFDDSPKKPVELKIEEAVDAFTRRFNRRPNVVLVNEADVVEVHGVTVRKESFIRRDNFWVGWEEREKLPIAIVAEPQKTAVKTRKTAKAAV